VIGSSIRAGGAISKVMASADEAEMLTASAREVNQAANLARTSQVLNGASTVTDGAALADSTYGLAKGWDKLSPEQRLMAIGQIGFWGGMMAHSSHEAMGNNFYASKDVDAFMHGVASRPKESLTNPAIPESRPVVERVQGAVREGFALSEADARVLGAMNGEGSHPIELSPQLKQQLGIYGKKVTTEDVLRRLGSIEKKKQEGLTATKAEGSHVGFTNKGKPHKFVPREKALQNFLKEVKDNGVVIHSDEEATRYLDWCAKQHGAPPESFHAVTLGDDIFVRPEYADNVRVLREELVHVYQQREGADITKVVDLEIDARLQLIQNRHEWGITNNEVREMIQEIRIMRKTGRY
jgi:hypothetical protein